VVLVRVDDTRSGQPIAGKCRARGEWEPCSEDAVGLSGGRYAYRAAVLSTAADALEDEDLAGGVDRLANCLRSWGVLEEPAADAST
jgi:hypothetical protein